MADTPLMVAQAWQHMFFKEFRCNGRVVLTDAEFEVASADFMDRLKQESPWTQMQWAVALARVAARCG